MRSSIICRPGSMTSAKKIIPFPQRPIRARDYELAFLPAALEITETPPSPTRRIVGVTIIALFCLALGWASLGTTDIVATAPGKIVPSGRTKIIQPFETGVVRAIHVQDGQSVKAGDVIIELDPTMSKAELGHLKSDLVTTQLEVARLRPALGRHADPRAKVQSEYRRVLFDDLAKAEQKAGGLAQDVIKAEERTNLQILTAPVDGVVQQLAVHTVGGVVTPAQALAVVVPVDSHLEIEAMLSNRDIGFIRAGQEAEIKVDTFNFTQYGLLRGEVLSVSQDAITRDKPPDRSNDKTSQGSEASTSES